MISKGWICHLVQVNHVSHESGELVPIVTEFVDVFPEDLPGIPPMR